MSDHVKNYSHGGRDALTNPELIAILLRTGAAWNERDRGRSRTSEQIQFFAELSRCSVNELVKSRESDPAKALELVAAFQSGKTFCTRKLCSNKNSIRRN